MARRGDRVCVTAQNVIEFWNVCTRPPSVNGLGLTLNQTARHVARIETLFRFLPEDPVIFQEWKRLVRDRSVSGLQVYDTRLVAVMNVYGIQSVLTYNVRDFRRFSGISVLHPETIAPS